MNKTDRAIQRARLDLIRAIDRACVARGEALWTNGYRAARQACGAESEAEDARLFAKELAQFARCSVTEGTVSQAITRYASRIRESFNPMRRKPR